MATVQYKRPRVKRVVSPKPVPPPKPPRPRRTTLKRIYRDLIAISRDQRLEMIIKAMHWYEELMAYLPYYSDWTKGQMKHKVNAEKRRLVGLNSNKTEKKESEYVAAIHEYELMTRSFHPPKIGVYLSKYSHIRHKLAGRQRKLDNKFGEFLNLVDKVFKPKNYDGTRIKLGVAKLKHDYIIDSEGNITFDRKYLDKARKLTRSSGLLPGCEKLLRVLAKAGAIKIETDVDHHRTGRYVVDGAKRFEVHVVLVHELIQYGLYDKHPKRLLRRHRDEVYRSTESTVAA